MANDSDNEFLSADTQEERTSITSSNDLLEPARVSIASSNSYEFEDIGRFLAKTLAVVITLIGDRDSGKSTLICSIYDRFLHGPFANLNSAGSLTITGLEQQVHYERVESGRDTPDTQHTSLAEGLKYFHFKVCPENMSDRPSDLLISDRAGELYKNARGNPALESSLIELRVADYLVVLVDGARVVNPTTHAGSFFAVRQTLQMLADRQPANAKYQVQIVLTKIDLIDTASTAEDLQIKLEQFRTRLIATFEARFASLTFFNVAARAMKGDYTRAYGVSPLIQSWLAGPKQRRSASTNLSSAVTEFDLLAERHPPSEVSK